MISSCAVRDKQSKKKSFLLAFKTILLYMCTASVHSLLLAYFMVKLPFHLLIDLLKTFLVLLTRNKCVYL